MSSSLTRTLFIGVLLLLGALNVWQYVSRPGPEPAPAAEKPVQVIDRFHQLFYENRGTWNNLWLGLQTWQNPNDVWITQEIITEQKPDFIVECGTHTGGSACIWAMVLQQVNPTGRVITIDIEDRTQQARDIPIWKERVDFLLGSSTDPATVADVTKRVKGKKVLVLLDSDHKKEHVLNELMAYSPLVDIGGYLLVQDTNVNGHPVFKDHGPGPMEAVEEFLAANKDFESDRDRERLLFTMHPKGYLKRVQ